MGKIFYMMGKSSSGKDTIFQEIFKRQTWDLRRIVLYTTRPARANEKNGVDYYFVNETVLDRMQHAGQVIELRAYQTVHGVWKYFTADEGQIDLKEYSYLAIGTLESYYKMRDYFGEERVVPIYIEVEDGERLSRALERERNQSEPKYEELCRRFLADSRDFSEENLKCAGIKKRFQNNGTLEACVEEILMYIGEKLKEEEKR
ncbi:MAG: guanylate kinase [Lachnospiraceae bacterium]|nr:guanylate kinase [Robinsoniella sp.]MDY3766316.1 guanylate kinase [Lachnospiraceae bacterium]